MAAESGMTCAECGRVLTRRPKEKPSSFAQRRFCSRRCAAAAGTRLAQVQRLAEPPPQTIIERNGYLLRWVRGKSPPPSASAHSGTYIYEHRRVMEAHLGRELRAGEVVHHVNGDRHDNRIENLRLFASQSEHKLAEGIERSGPFPNCPVCGEAARRGRTYCSRRCAAIYRNQGAGAWVGCGG